MNEHTFKILEFGKVIDKIKGKCLTPFGAENVLSIKPLFVKKEIEQKLKQVSELKDIINFGTPFPLYRTEDCRFAINQSKVADLFIDPKDMLAILHLIKHCNDLYQYNKDDRENFPLIAELLASLRAFPELKEEIERAIDVDGEIKDNASKKLRSIRSELGASKQKITQKLEQMLAKQKKQPGWQDDVVTIRNDRYVIGVPTNKYQAEMGILHDRSQTGATFFIEPKESVELNNRIHMLYQEERIEIIRILKALTKEIGSRSESILQNIDILGQLDCIHACASFSNEIQGNAPKILDEPQFNLMKSKHPLLMVQFADKSQVIANDINLDDNRQAILITGPNTGGKTILLKTVGLSVLLAQSGLHISADEKSEVGIFHDIFADIGDEQSIELSLSTFSSHIKNIIEGITGASGTTLILFDEIGAGTDPKEGSALAESVILDCIKKQTKLIVTTHYSQLKTLAMEYPELENASLEFDRATLAPTYKLRLGIPGSSYAVEIAERLGMPKEICEKAVSLLSSGEKSLDKLITSLEEELKTIRADKNELTEKLEKANQLENYYRTQTDHLKREVETEKSKALADTSDFIVSTRREIEHLVAEIRSSQASDESVKAFHRKLKESEAELKNRVSKPKKKKEIDGTFRIGDTVEIITLNQIGEIDELIGREKAKIKVGNIFTTVDLRNLKKRESASSKPKTKVSFSFSDNDAPTREIHLRGMTVEEALEKLERFIDHALVSGLGQIYVIHGKGAGILRRMLTEYLRNHKEVASVRLGDFNEGGAGVSVVKLKE
ncbi:MAG: endonuclease MutS2 [Calditrichaeota bacterium]|nr:MAG: endonuclease MutS2 [Calditrichota bacterium]